MEDIILKAKAIGKDTGTELEAEYRFVLYENRDGVICLRPEQSFNGEFNEFSKLPGWALDSLRISPVDELFIDHGAKWSVSGLLEAINEAIKLI